MSELYWITVLGHISCVTGILSAVSFIALVVLIVACIVAYFDNCTNTEDFKKLVKVTKIAGIFAILITIITIFVPSTKQALLIYGVGETVDYIRQNPTAKQLPDKCIKVLDKWADSQLETDSI